MKDYKKEITLLFIVSNERDVREMAEIWNR